MKTFPGTLHHRTPSWVPDTAIFHVRIRVDKKHAESLIHGSMPELLLESIRVYRQQQKWSCLLAVIRPDHLHALLSFGRENGLSSVVGNWKAYHKRINHVQWQNNFFDHRIRNHEELSEKYHYIARNPVALGLCASPEEWKWRLADVALESVPHF